MEGSVQEPETPETYYMTNYVSNEDDPILTRYTAKTGTYKELVYIMRTLCGSDPAEIISQILARKYTELIFEKLVNAASLNALAENIGIPKHRRAGTDMRWVNDRLHDLIVFFSGVGAQLAEEKCVSVEVDGTTYYFPKTEEDFKNVIMARYMEVQEMAAAAERALDNAKTPRGAAVPGAPGAPNKAERGSVKVPALDSVKKATVGAKSASHLDASADQSFTDLSSAPSIKKQEDMTEDDLRAARVARYEDNSTMWSNPIHDDPTTERRVRKSSRRLKNKIKSNRRKSNRRLLKNKKKSSKRSRKYQRRLLKNKNKLSRRLKNKSRRYKSRK